MMRVLIGVRARTRVMPIAIDGGGAAGTCHQATGRKESGRSCRLDRLFWRIENFPTLAQAQAAAGPTGLAAESAGRCGSSRSAPRVGHRRGAPRLPKLGHSRRGGHAYLLRINEARGAPGSITAGAHDPGSEAFYVLAGSKTSVTPPGVMRVSVGRPETGHGADTPIEVWSSGSTDLHSAVMFVVDADKPALSPGWCP